jgi:hypothetical protein
MIGSKSSRTRKVAASASKKRFLQSVVATVVALGALAGTATSASAWYNDGKWCPGIGPSALSCVTEWTGGYPSGLVRGFGQRNNYQVTLQTNSGAGWINVATTYPQTSNTAITPSVRAGKFNYYRTGVRTVRGGRFLVPGGPYVYLGD